MHAFTDLLPEIDAADLDRPPPALGDSTEAAIRSGLFYGALGAIRELTKRLASAAARPPVVFLTGGARPRWPGCWAPTPDACRI